MPQFEVKPRRDGWLEAECLELGVLITAKTRADVEATARKTAERASKQVVFKYKAAQPSLPKRLWRWLAGAAPSPGRRIR